MTVNSGLVPLLDETGRFPDSFAPPSVEADMQAAQAAQAQAEEAAQNAAGSATTATTMAGVASSAATAAATSESNAATSASNAATSESNAATSESQAAASAGVAQAAAAAVTAELESGASKRQAVLNVAAAVPGVWRTNLATVPVPIAAALPWSALGAGTGPVTIVPTGGPYPDVADAWSKLTFTTPPDSTTFYGYRQPVEAGKTYALSMSGIASWDCANLMQVVFYDANSTQVGSIIQSPWSDVYAGGSWNRCGVVATAPAGAVRASLRYAFRVGSGSATPATGAWFGASAALAEESSQIGSFFTGSSLLAYWQSTSGQSAATQFVPLGSDTSSSSLLVVSHATGESSYTTIQSAVSAASDGDTILIMPGTYTEQVAAWGKTVHLLGVCRDTCILIDHSSDYDTPPLEIGSGSVRNMTIIEDHASPDPALQTGSDTDGKAFNLERAYTLHIEDYTAIGKALVVEDCTIRNTKRAAIGMGTYDRQQVTFRNCDIWSGLPTRTADVRRGAFYFHNYSIGSISATDQHVILDHNRIVCDDTIVMRIADTGAEGKVSTMLVTALGNAVYSSQSGHAPTIVETPKSFPSNADISISPESWGNSTDPLNA